MATNMGLAGFQSGGIQYPTVESTMATTDATLEPEGKRQKVEEPAITPTPNLTTEQIEALIRSREESRRAKAWDAADSIRQQLRNAAVEVFDKERKWTCSDGRTGRTDFSCNVCKLTDEQIRMLVFDRENARKENDYAKADSLREELRNNGVELYDKDKIWKSCDDRMGFLTAQVSEIKDQDIASVVSKREVARQNKDYEQADKLRQCLRTVGVEIWDKDKMWKATDGRRGYFGQVPGQMPQMMAPMMGLQGATPMMAPASLYGMAPQQMMYPGSSPSPQMVPQPMPAHQPGAGGTLTLEQISFQVTQREIARQNKDYVTADSIRNQLRGSGIDVRDKEREWRAQDGRTGPIPTWSEINPNTATMPSPAFPAVSAPPPPPQQQPVTAGYMATHTGVAGFPSGGFQYPTQPATQPAVAATSLPGLSATELLSDEHIMTLLASREQARRSKDFPTADSIRELLRNAGVEIWDKERTWKSTLDGRTGAIP